MHFLAMLRPFSAWFWSHLFKRTVTVWCCDREMTVMQHWEVRGHQFLWYYLRLPLLSMFADYNLSGVFHLFEWAILFFNSWEFEWNFRYVNFKQILVIDGWGISCEIALIWMSLEFTDNQSTLVQVMAWCRQATSHCLSHCWPTSLSPYGVTRAEWVNRRYCIIFTRYSS